MPSRPIYYDTETTGVKAGKDRIVEIAAYDPTRDKTFCSFINPECPIPPEATQISQITDEMVKDAPLVGEVLLQFEQFCEGDIILIAHNNDGFDKHFLHAEYTRAGRPIPSWKYLDSLKWARKYRPDLPRHGLQALREVYGIVANQAHRALDDVLVLYQVFQRMIDNLPWEKIAELIEQSSTVKRMPFGKHAGKMLAEVPKNYVEWLAESGAFNKEENRSLKEAFVGLGYLS